MANSTIMNDWSLHDYRFPDEAYDGKETFACILRSFFPRWAANAKAAGLSKNWNSETSRTYASHYLDRILPVLDPNKPMHEYEEDDFEAALTQLQQKYHMTEMTLEHYRYLLWIVYKAGYTAGYYSDNIFWDDVYDPSEHTAKENEDHRIHIMLRLRKSLTMKENVAIIKWFQSLDPTAASGEDVALLCMYAFGLRNNEACGLNYRNLYTLEKYQNIYLLDAGIQTTQIGKNLLKAGGKTSNAPRTLFALQPVAEFLLRRKAHIQRLVDAGEFVLPDTCDGSVDELPIACRGTSWGKRCSSNDVTARGRELFEKIGISKRDLAEMGRMIHSQAFRDAGIDEKEATTYLLRRNFATTLYMLGLPQSDIQYYIGHSVEDPSVSRNHYTNKDKLLSLRAKLEYHPLCLMLSREMCNQPANTALHQRKDVAADDIDMSKLGAYRHFIAEATASEPNDSITLVIESDAPFDISLYYTKAILAGYSETANIRQIMADAYQNVYQK